MCFVPEPTIKTYIAKGHDITLRLEPGVFCPSEQGRFIGEYVDVSSGERVLDMGTGTGFLGIVAAKEGGVVDVSDSSARAVSLAVKNASLNGVAVKGYVGEYFCTPTRIYDYIIANLPQEILLRRYREEIGALETTIDGGEKGNERILTFLDRAHQHMQKGSRVLFVAYSMSDYITTLQKMKSLYNARLLDVITTPAKDFVQEHIGEYLPRIDTGEVGLFKKDGLWQSTLFMYELQRKQSS